MPVCPDKSSHVFELKVLYKTVRARQCDRLHLLKCTHNYIATQQLVLPGSGNSDKDEIKLLCGSHKYAARIVQNIQIEFLVS